MAYLILKHIIPGPATQYISDKELEEIKRDVEDDTVDPNDTSPSPTNTMYLCKAPIGIHSNHRSNLINQAKLIKFSSRIMISTVELRFNQLTSCATMKAKTSRRPGRSRKDQLRDLVTKISA